LVIENKLNNKNDKEQFNALKQGFYEIIPQYVNILLDDIDLKVNQLIFNKIFYFIKYRIIIK